MTTTMFYYISQNNAGGYWITNDNVGIGAHIFIQAHTAEEAIATLEKIGEDVIGLHDYCNCCGERWFLDAEDMEEYAKSGYPQIRDTHIEEGVPKSYMKNKEFAFVHYIDGTIEKYPKETP